MSKRPLSPPSQSVAVQSDTGEPNGSPTQFSTAHTLHELFEQQCRKTPAQIALICPDDRNLTFDEVNKQANRIAHLLHNRGVRPRMLVGICVLRSPAMVIALLGILKAGATYVPLDPNSPPDRLAYLMQDSGIELLVTEEPLLLRCQFEVPNIVLLDRHAPAIAEQPAHNPASGTTADDAAYIIYTSGSTGEPKGVVGHHRGLVNCCRWMQAAYPFAPGEVCCQKTYLSFVDAVEEIFGPLLEGIPLLVIPDSVVQDPDQFVSMLAQYRVSRIFLVPSLLRLLLNYDAHLAQRLQHLRLWVVGGEALPTDLALAFCARMPGHRLVNIYGMSEAAADTTYYEVNPAEIDRTVPIGKPIANTLVYLFDKHGQPVPLGSTGEIYVGGVNLAHGYLNRPELTAERFVPNPLGDRRAPVLFKTGDRGRMRPDGNLEYVGRADYQVSIRGIRVEPEELEVILRGHPLVGDAVVAAWSDPSGNHYLAAYVTGQGAPPPPSNVLRAYLGERLPEFMLPSVFVSLDSLPLNPSGKVDRRSLPDPGHLALHANSDYAAPRSELELQLVSIWEEVLGRRPVGIHDNFFEIGGHSLLAAVLVSKINERLGRQLPLAALLKAPTIAQAAEELERGCVEHTESLLVPLHAAGSLAPFFCVHGFGGDVVGYYKLAHLLGPDQPFYGIQAQGLYDGLEPHADVKSMAEAYVRALREAQPQGPYYLGGYCDGGVIAYEMARHLHDQGQHVALLAVFEGYAVDRDNAKRQHWRPSVLTSFVRNLPHWMRDNVPHVMRNNPRSLGPLAGGQAGGGNSSASQPAHRLRILDLHDQAITDYRPQPYAGHLSLFRVRAMSLFRSHDPTLGWEELAAGGVTVHMIPGAHHNILEHPHVEGLAAALRDALAQSRSAFPEVSHRSPPPPIR